MHWGVGLVIHTRTLEIEVSRLIGVDEDGLLEMGNARLLRYCGMLYLCVFKVWIESQRTLEDLKVIDRWCTLCSLWSVIFSMGVLATCPKYMFFTLVQLLDTTHASCTGLMQYCLYSVYIILSGSAHTVAAHTLLHRECSAWCMHGLNSKLFQWHWIFPPKMVPHSQALHKFPLLAVQKSGREPGIFYHRVTYRVARG